MDTETCDDNGSAPKVKKTGGKKIGGKKKAKMSGAICAICQNRIVGIVKKAKKQKKKKRSGPKKRR